MQNPEKLDALNEYPNKSILSERTIRRDEIDATRNRVHLSLSLESIHLLQMESLLPIQRALLHGEEPGFWVTPKKWVKTQHGNATINIDIRNRIKSFLAPDLGALLDKDNTNQQVDFPKKRLLEILEQAILVATRYFILLRMGPAGLGKRGRSKSLDPKSISLIAYSAIPRMLALSISKLSQTREYMVDSRSTQDINIRFFNKLELSDFKKASQSTEKMMLIEASRMQRLAQNGYWSDVPAVGQTLDVFTRVQGEQKKYQRERKIDSHLPFPDEYISEMGTKSVWIIKNLAPNLLTLISNFQTIWSDTALPHLTPSQIQWKRRRLVTHTLQNFLWVDVDGKSIKTPPFSIRLAESGAKGKLPRKSERLKPDDSDPATLSEASHKNLKWPPKTFAEIIGLVANVQLAHFFVAMLSTGGRKSEILGLERDCVKYSVNGMPYANGRTFKLVERLDGEIRDWVLPDLAVTALEQQRRLISLTEALGPTSPVDKTDVAMQNGTHIWGQLGIGGISSRVQPLTSISKALTSYAKALGMSTYPGGQNLRSHRFRKTVARLVALAITQAPKVLMDIFGHKSIEMTLYYILSDKELQSEIETVSRELRVLRAKKTIEELIADEDKYSDAMTPGGFGGPAALIIKKSIHVHKERVHESGKNWGANDITELAEILTLQGKTWACVRPGIICTKFPGTESGPCNKSKGHPEPARCQTHCSHRLEESFLREDVNGAIGECIREYQLADRNGEDLTKEFWAGQIRMHLGRFEDIRVKWSSNQTVKAVIST